MQFKKNLQDMKEMRQEDPPETFDVEHAKLRINQCLFEIMPPRTTLDDLDDLAMAIFKTVQDSWK